MNFGEASDRSEAEKRAVTALGLHHMNVPMTGLTAPTDAELEEILLLLENKTSGPVFVHCWRDADRTGAVIAAYYSNHDRWATARAIKAAKDDSA